MPGAPLKPQVSASFRLVSQRRRPDRGLWEPNVRVRAEHPVDRGRVLMSSLVEDVPVAAEDQRATVRVAEKVRDLTHRRASGERERRL